METLKLIYTLIKMFPAFKQFWDDLVSLYVQQQISQMKKENRDAIRLAFETHDQRPIEEILGPGAGEHSGLVDSEIREELPDVKPINPKP